MSPSFGDTCAGRKKAAATLSLLGLLLAAIAFQPGFVASASAAADSSTSPVPLSLGFSPSSLSPVSGGTPVYTVGETIWAESGYNSAINASLSYSGPSPGVAFGAVVAQLSLQPQVVTPIHTFTQADSDGIWNISLASPSGPVIVPVRFVNLADHRPALQGPLQYSLDGGNLSITAQVDLSGFYDQEVCAVGTATGAPVVITLPSDMGELGSIALTPGTPFGLSTLGVNEPVSFWFELYHTYALDEGGTNNLVSDNLLAAQSQPIDLVSDGPTATNLTWTAPLRAGRYDLRAYFQNSTNLEVFQSSVLILNDSSWVSLSSTCLPQQVQSTGISYSGSLTAGQASWPRTLYYMYRTFGVEAVVAYPVNANISSVNLEASPWNASLQDAKLSVTSSSRVLQTSQEGSSVFVLTSGYPAQLNYSLGVGAASLSQGSLTIDGRYSTQTLDAATAELSVHLLANQSSPITVTVTGSGDVDVTRGPFVINRTLSLFLPTGSYTVTASQGGESQSARVGLTDGVASAVTLNFSAFAGLETILVVAAAIAVVANVVVWALRSRAARLRPNIRAKG